MVPDVDIAIVETGQHPWLRWMEINTFDTVRTCRQLPLYI